MVYEGVALKNIDNEKQAEDGRKELDENSIAVHAHLFMIKMKKAGPLCEKTENRANRARKAPTLRRHKAVVIQYSTLSRFFLYNL